MSIIAAGLLSIMTLLATQPEGGAKGPYWDKVKSQKRLVVAVQYHLPPMSMKDKTGQHFGLDVDLARHLGAVLGVEVVIKPTRFTALIPDLLAGKSDIAVASITRTAKRATLINFSRSYMDIWQAALVDTRFLREGRDERESQANKFDSYFDLKRLSGIRLGVKRGTQPEALARKYFPNARIVTFETASDAARALVRGEVMAMAHDSPFVSSWAARNRSFQYRIKPLVKKSTDESYGIAIRKGDLDFLEWLNMFVEEVRTDGTMDELIRRYFVSQEWVGQMAEEAKQ